MRPMMPSILYQAYEIKDSGTFNSDSPKNPRPNSKIQKLTFDCFPLKIYGVPIHDIDRRSDFDHVIISRVSRY